VERADWLVHRNVARGLASREVRVCLRDKVLRFIYSRGGFVLLFSEDVKERAAAVLFHRMRGALHKRKVLRSEKRESISKREKNDHK
jgi:hypothetical protein